MKGYPKHGSKSRKGQGASKPIKKWTPKKIVIVLMAHTSLGKMNCTRQSNLDDVLDMKRLADNLISSIHLCDQGLNVNFAKLEFLVTNEEGEFVMRGTRSKDNFYLWNPQDSDYSSTCLTLAKARVENIVSGKSFSKLARRKHVLIGNNVSQNVMTSCDDKFNTASKNSIHQGRTKHMKATRESTKDEGKFLEYVSTHFIKDLDIVKLDKVR